MERWSKSGDQIAGWAACADDDLDPDPVRRRPRLTSGHLEIDQAADVACRRLWWLHRGRHRRCFPRRPMSAPPSSATILYGLVAVTSLEKSETALPPSFDAGFFSEPAAVLPDPGEAAHDSDAPNQVLTRNSAGDPRLIADLNYLGSCSSEYDLFGDSAEGQALFDALNRALGRERRPVFAWPPLAIS